MRLVGKLIGLRVVDCMVGKSFRVRALDWLTV